MTTIPVTNTAPVELLPAGTDRWVSIQNQGGGTVRLKHDAVGDPVSSTSGYMLRSGETLLISDDPAAAQITARAEGTACVVCVQTGPIS